MRDKRFTILILLDLGIMLMVAGGCRHSAKRDHNYLEGLRAEATDSAMHRNFNASDSIGRLLYDEASRSSDKVYMAYGLLSQSFFNYSLDDFEKRYERAQKALEIGRSTNNDTLMSRIYNILGGYAMLHNYDFGKATYYFSEAKRHAENTGAQDFAIGAECNISEIYHTMGDTLGLPYDRDIYKFAKKNGQYSLLMSASKHLAEHYLSDPKTAVTALPYIRDIDSTGSPSARYLYNKLMGDYWRMSGNLPEAEKQYDKAISQHTGSPGVFLSYAGLLADRGNNSRSLVMLDSARRGLDESSPYNKMRADWLRLYYENYKNTGQHQKSLAYLEQYMSLCDSIKEFRNQEQVNKYRIFYETGKKDLEITRSHASIRTRNIILISIVSLFAIVVITMTIYYRKRSRMYSAIVGRQQIINDIRNTNLQHQTEEPSVVQDTQVEPKGQDEPVADQPQGLSREKSDEIWVKIQKEIHENKIYRDPTVSRDMFAAKVGCNHTWFSQVIKERTGKTYPQFMNSQRVEDSLVILADPASDLTHEELWRSLGFLAKSTFYNCFKAQMSMSPSEYRRLSLKAKNGS